MNQSWYKAKKSVITRHRNICYWCGNKLIQMRDIPHAKRIKLKKHYIIWRGDGKIKMGWVATVDHVRPRSRGGQNHQSNIVASCHRCNQVRAKFMQTNWKEKDHKTRINFIVSKFTNPVKKYRMSLAKKTRGEVEGL